LELYSVSELQVESQIAHTLLGNFIRT